VLLSNTTLEHDGLRKDGQPDKRVGTGGKNLTTFSDHDDVLTPCSEFAAGKVDPHEAGKKGGETGGSAGGASSGGSSGDSSGGSGNGQFAGGKVDPVEAGRKGGQSSN
jgi:hypothetical protein